MITVLLLVIIFLLMKHVCDKEDKENGVQKKDSLTGPIILGGVLGLISGIVDGIKKRK